MANTVELHRLAELFETARHIPASPAVARCAVSAKGQLSTMYGVFTPQERFQKCRTGCRVSMEEAEISSCIHCNSGQRDSQISAQNDMDIYQCANSRPRNADCVRLLGAAPQS